MKNITPKEFKILWESNDNGGGITFDDIAFCAKNLGISSRPKTMKMQHLLYKVLKMADVNDVENYKPQDKKEY